MLTKVVKESISLSFLYLPIDQSAIMNNENMIVTITQLMLQMKIKYSFVAVNYKIKGAQKNKIYIIITVK